MTLMLLFFRRQDGGQSVPASAAERSSPDILVKALKP